MRKHRDSADRATRPLQFPRPRPLPADSVEPVFRRHIANLQILTLEQPTLAKAILRVTEKVARRG